MWAPVEVGTGGGSGWRSAATMLERAVVTAPGSCCGRLSAAATFIPSTTATPRLLNALGTTRNTSFSMIGVTAALAGPVTEAAPAPTARSSEPVAAAVVAKTTGLRAAPSGTVAAPCRAYGQMTPQY